MTKFKSLIFITFLIVISFVIIGCGKDTTKPKLTITRDSITHAVNEEIDLEFKDCYTVEDDTTAVEEIKIEIDLNGYDRSVDGLYNITIKATDNAGNQTIGKITVLVKNDMLAPMLKTNLPLTHLAGEEVDLTRGLEGVDNIDGVNVIFKVSDYGTYDKNVPGEYKVKITMSDKAGNLSNPFERTIVVTNSYSRAEMTSFEGNLIRYKALYNPQVLNGNTQTGFNSAYDGNYVNVISKDYLEWLMEYAPERLGSGIGWSVVAVTNENDEIVYVRHWSSGDAWHNEQGELVTSRAYDWSTGTIFTWTETVNENLISHSNAKYSTGEMGLMMANINEKVPENGKVFIFMNWTTIEKNENDQVVLKANASDMARAMGANYIMNSDENGDDVFDYAIGRELKLVDQELSDQSIRKTFDKENPFPIITIPSSRYVTDTGIWKNQYTETVYLPNYNEQNPYNPLRGVTANDGKGNDITANITYKLYKWTNAEAYYKLAASIPLTDAKWKDFYETTWDKATNEVTLEQALKPEFDGYYFAVEYVVTANGHTDIAYRLIQIESQTPDYIELYGETDAVYTEVMGLEQRLEMNPDLDEFGSFDQTEKGILYDAKAFKELGTLPILDKGVVVVLDNYYRIQVIRVTLGTAFEIDQAGATKSTNLTWTSTDLLAGLKDVVPTGGYVVIYPEGKDGKVITKALKAYYDFDYVSGDISTVNQANGVVAVEMIIKEVKEVSTLLVNDVAPTVNINNNNVNVQVIENSKDSLVFKSTGGGAGFRLDNGKAYYYTKSQYQTLVSSTEVVDSFTTGSPNKGVPWFNNGVIIVLDANGKFALARFAVGGVAELKADGTVIFGNPTATVTTEAAKATSEVEKGPSNLSWDIILPNANNTVAHGPLANILSVVPEGGSFFIMPNSKTSVVRDLAIKLLWNNNYISGAIVDSTLQEQPAGSPNPATNGYDFTNYTVEYLTNLNLEVQFVATVSDKPLKISRPVVTLNNNEISWAKVENAGSYDVYINGFLAKTNAGVLSEDQTKYTYNLGLLSLVAGTYSVQVRAISANPATNATSVLSDIVSYNCVRLNDATNFVLNDNVLSWDAVEGATKYYVSIDGGENVEVITNSVVIPDDKLVAGTLVKVVSAGSETLLDSVGIEYTLDIEVIEKEITIGAYTLPMKEFTVSSWMRYVANDGSAQNVEGLVVVNGANAISSLEDTAKLINGGYVALLGSDMKVKYYADRWTHQWTASAGWTQQATVSPWAWGLDMFASYFKPYLAEGDILVIASQYGKGLTEGTYRNILGNALLKDLGSAVLTSPNDHRLVTDFTGVIDPSTVTIEINEVVQTKTISLGNNDLPIVEYDLAAWLNIASPTGGNNVGANNIPGIIMVTNAYGINQLADDVKIFAGGYVAVIGSDMKVKYFADRWTHEWNPTAGWTQRETATWTWGANLFASYFKPYLAEGDFLLMASQYGTGLPAGTYRNYMGNAFIKDLGLVTSDHRAVLPADCINLANITITIKEATKVITLGKSVLDVKEFTIADWMQYASPIGGNDVSAQFVQGIIVINDAFGIKDLTDDSVIINGGYIAVIGSDMKVKYLVDRWAHEWNPTNGWTTNAGSWPWALNIKASYLKPYLAEGDIVIMAGQYGNGLVSGTYRNLFGNALIKDLVNVTTDHRSVDLAQAIDLTTVTIKFTELN